MCPGFWHSAAHDCNPPSTLGRRRRPGIVRLRVDRLCAGASPTPLVLPPQLGGMAALREAELVNCGLQWAAPPELLRLTALERLSLRGNPIASLQHLSALRRLVELDVVGCAALDTLAALATCTALRQLRVGTLAHAQPIWFSGDELHWEGLRHAAHERLPWVRELVVERAGHGGGSSSSHSAR